MDIQIYSDAETLAARAAEFIVAAAQDAVAQRGRFAIALAGGSTPKATYAALAAPERAGQVEWSKTFVFFGDERFGRPDGPDSNYGMAKLSLLDHVNIPPDNIFPMPTKNENDEQSSAAAYIQSLSEFFGVPPHGLPPRFDLILLGLGDDGHTASIFPGAPTTTITDTWVAPTPPGTLPPPVDRLTFTFPLLNAARQIAFLVSGDGKAGIAAEVLEGHATGEAHPAERVQPPDGQVTWLMDAAAAGQLRRQSRL